MRSMQGTNVVVHRRKMDCTDLKRLKKLVYRSNPHKDGERRSGGELMGVEWGRGVFVREPVEELRGEGGVKGGGLQCRNSHVGFLWADLGSWCLDKASDFPARNVHSPRETANHRKRGRQRERDRERKKQTERGRERRKKKQQR